jgi:hypothetical protein
MNRICATLLAACLAGVGGTAPSHEVPKKDAVLPKKLDAPSDSLKREPRSAVCATDDSVRFKELRKGTVDKNGMPPKDGLNDCLDNVPMPLRPMARRESAHHRMPG